MYKVISLLSVACILTLTVSCDEDPPEGSACNPQFIPLVFVHGFLASGDTYKNQEMRFNSNDYCLDHIFSFDWNSLSSTDHTPDLDDFIDNVLAVTGASKVNLAGHSAGGGLCYDYLAQDSYAEKVASYVHLASFGQDGPAGPSGSIPTMNIWSEADEVVEGSNIPNARNVILSEFDHYEVATNAVTFDSMYAFFNANNLASVNEIIPQNEVHISGRAVSFGENEPVISGEIEIYKLDESTGFRMNEQPDGFFVTDDEGYWGPFLTENDVYYEFRIKKDESSRPIHYYMEPFIRSSSMVYLRTLPSPTSLAGLIMSQLPSDDDQSVIAIFPSNQAVINGRDELFVEGIELSTPALASAASSTIAFFLYDEGDLSTSGEAIDLFATFPFINGVDIYFPTDNEESIEAEFNGRMLKMRNWPSATEGPIVAVFN